MRLTAIFEFRPRSGATGRQICPARRHFRIFAILGDVWRAIARPLINISP